MKQQLVYFAMVAMGLVWLSGCSPKEQTIVSQRQNNWADADPAAITAAELEPEADIMPDTHFAAGRLFEKQGTLNKAIIQYQKALMRDPNHVASLNRLGVLYAQSGRHNDAEKMLFRAIETSPDSPGLHNNLGFDYVLQERWRDAEAEFRNAIQLKPDFQRAHINLGLTLARLNRFDEALAEFRAVLPEPDAFYNLGLMFRGKHRYRDAADAFQLALDFNPDFAVARMQLEQIKPRLELSTDLEPMLDEVHWQAMTDIPTDAPAIPKPAIMPNPPYLERADIRESTVRLDKGENACEHHAVESATVLPNDPPAMADTSVVVTQTLLEANDMTLETTNISLETADITFEAANISLETADMTLETANISLETADMTFEADDMTFSSEGPLVEESLSEGPFPCELELDFDGYVTVDLTDFESLREAISTGAPPF